MGKLVITGEQLKKALKLGIKAKNAESVKAELLEKLAENGVDNVENETMDELLEMYEAFYEAAAVEGEEETEEETEEEEEAAEETEEEEVERLADEEEEEEAPKKPTKTATAPVKKAAVSAPVAKTAAPAKKEATTAVKKEPKKPTEKYTAWVSEDKADKKAVQPLIALFPEAVVKWLKQGFTIFYPGKSSQKAIISYDRLKKSADGTVVGDLFFNALKGKDEVHTHIGEDKDYKHFNANLLFLSKMSIEDSVELLEEGDLIEHMNKSLSLADKRAVSNREKLEEKVAGEKSAVKDTKKLPVKAKAVVEEETEEEEETPVAKKKAAPAPVAKAPVKKAVAKVEEEQETEEEEEEAPVKKAVVAKKK